MGCNSSKQVQIEQAGKPTGSGGDKVPGKPVRGDLYVAWPSPPCRAVLMTCAALGIKPNLKALDLFKGETRTPEFIAVNPFHTVPTYVDGDFKLWESRAIMSYMVTMFGGPDHALYPGDVQKRALVDNVLNADQSTFTKGVVDWVTPQLSGKAQDTDMNERLEGLKKALGVMENFYLTNNTFLAGPQVTIADLSVVAVMLLVEVAKFDFSEFPKVQNWMAQMKKLPYFEMCNKKGMEMLMNRVKEQHQQQS